MLASIKLFGVSGLIVFLSFSFKKGGAAIAAKKFRSIMDGYIDRPNISISQDGASKHQFIKRLISYTLSKFQFDGNPIKHSLNLFSCRSVLNSFSDRGRVHHIHWINNDTLSVFDFDKIPSGSIITLHDEWLYCGSEHYYKVLDDSHDFVSGYKFFKNGVWGVNWNFIIWKIKCQSLGGRRDLIFTVPSHWMLGRAKESFILNGADIRLLPNPIDIDQFMPFPEESVYSFRHSLGFSSDDIIIVSGAVGGRSNYLKGSHLLDEALAILSASLDGELSRRVKFLDFGGRERTRGFLHGFESVSLGHISDPSELALLYSSADFLVMPSLVESFGQVAAEALACETPVISFVTSGLVDIVIDGETGFTAEFNCPSDLAKKIKKIIMIGRESRVELGRAGRKYIVRKFSYPVIALQYEEIIRDALLLKIVSNKSCV